ncbi:MAG: elongation factor G [Bacillota bacterium]
MTKVKTSDIRNVCFISHGGAGKTTLTEQILHNAGQIKEPGTIERGNTKSDFMPEEKEHKYSINSSYFTIPWNGKEVNLIDTPGYTDFRGEVASSTNMVESAVLLIDGSSGVEVNTHYVWKQAVKNNLSKFIFINKLDKEGINFDEVYQELEDTFSDDNLIPLTLPRSVGEEYDGYIDLLNQQWIKEDGSKEDIPDDMADMVADYRMSLIEPVVEIEDELMMKYLEDEEITDEELTSALAHGVAEKELVPVFSGSALNNSGVKYFFNKIVELTPSPLNNGVIKGIDSNENEKELEVSQDGPVIALVGKTMVDPYIGKLSIFRIYSGKMDKSQEYYIPRSEETFTTSKFYKLNGENQEEVEELVAGEIGAVAKVDELETSDTICTPETDIELPEIEFPKPMLTQSTKPVGDGEKLSEALNRYSLQDPTFKVNYNTITKQLLVTGTGTVHLSIVNDVCQRKFDVGFETSTPKVAYKETIQKQVEVEEKYKKQSGGRGQYGHVMLRIKPLPRGEGFEFDEEIFGGAIPNQYIPGVEKGVREAMEEGVLAGYPAVDIKAVVYDGSYHDVDSSEMAFKIAASKAFRQGMKKAKPVLLEPIMDVKVRVPESFMGDIMGDLNSRRGRIMGMDPENGDQIIKAQVPQAEMFNYASDLKSITGGYGKYDMEFSHYDKVPGEIAEDIIKNSRDEE